MNTQNYWWQIVKVEGEFKVKIFDMETNTSVYLNTESVKMMNTDLQSVQTRSDIYHIQEEVEGK